MDGVNFITDEKGKKNAFVIDLKKHSKICEDMYDSINAVDRAKELKENYESVK